MAFTWFHSVHYFRFIITPATYVLEFIGFISSVFFIYALKNCLFDFSALGKKLEFVVVILLSPLMG